MNVSKIWVVHGDVARIRLEVMGMGVEGGAKVGRRIGIHHSFIYPVIIY
jgi:hypothetical protein